MGTSETFPKAKANTRITAAVVKSSATIIFRLFFLSAITPPKREKIANGIKEQAVTAPKSDEESVSRSR